SYPRLHSRAVHCDQHSLPPRRSSDLHEVLQQSMAGNVPDSRLVLVMDYEDLARRGLIDPATNETTLRVGDRLVRLLNGIGVLLRSEEHTSELQSRENLVCRLLLEKKN